MKCRIFSILFVLAGSVFLTSESAAQSRSGACASELNPKSNAFELIECVRELAFDLRDTQKLLESAIVEIGAQSASQVPSGAVIALDRSGNCPRGWTPYAAAAGRTIIGMGSGNFDQSGKALKEKGFGETGGEETVTLNAEQLARHNHPLTMFYGEHFDGTGGSLPQGGDYDAKFVREDAGRTQLAGGGQPHNNMPPYIALYFCKKD